MGHKGKQEKDLSSKKIQTIIAVSAGYCTEVHISKCFLKSGQVEKVASWLFVNLVGKGMLHYLIAKSSILKKSFPHLPQLLRSLFGFYLPLPPLYTYPLPFQASNPSQDRIIKKKVLKRT